MRNHFATIETHKYIPNYQPLFIRLEKPTRDLTLPIFVQLDLQK